MHHALCNLIEPLLERGFIYDSYANRRGKGTHAALDRAQGFSQEYVYVLKCDIEQFFPHIDHQLLFAQLSHRLADPQTLRLCRLILESGAAIHQDIPPAFFPGDDLFAAIRPRGLPIGNLTSQFWANVYLNPLHHFIKRELKCPAYCRYVDDFLLFANSKAELHHWRAAIIEYLASLRLTLHENEAQVFPAETGIPFLGWRLYPSHRLLRKRNGLAFQRRYAQMRRDYAGGRLSFERLNASVQGWVAHVRHGSTWGLRRSLLSPSILPSHQGEHQEWQEIV